MLAKALIVLLAKGYPNKDEKGARAACSARLLFFGQREQVMRNVILSAVLAVFGASNVAAQTGPDLAQMGLQPRIDALAQNPKRHGFELGMLSALRGIEKTFQTRYEYCLLYTSPSPRDRQKSRMPSSA